MKNLTKTLIATLLLWTPTVFAQVQSDATQAAMRPGKTLITALGNMAIFAAFGTLLLVAGFKAFDFAIRKIDLEAEILKGNTAAGVLAGAVIIGLAIVIAMAMF